MPNKVPGGRKRAALSVVAAPRVEVDVRGMSLTFPNDGYLTSSSEAISAQPMGLWICSTSFV